MDGSNALSDDLKSYITQKIGPIARPDEILFAAELPKTRSVKIMRRVLALISNRRDVGDVTTLANPDVVEQIREMVQGKGAVVSPPSLFSPEAGAKNSSFPRLGGRSG